MLAGELYLPVPQATAYDGNDTRELHLPLTMKLAWTPWTVEDVSHSVQSYIQHVPPHGWPSWIFSTHDCLRLAMRLQREQTRVAAMLLLTLPGTPVLYYGEEIGMCGVPIPAEQAIDPQGRRTGRNRDPERTPMQWNMELHAGFSSLEPWLPIAEDFQTANVSSQSGNSRSLLTLYHRLFAIRHDKSFFLNDRPEFLNVHNSLLAYLRKSQDDNHLVVLNFSGEQQTLERDHSFQARVCLSTFLDKEGEESHGRLDMRGHEGLILSCD